MQTKQMAILTVFFISLISVNGCGGGNPRVKVIDPDVTTIVTAPPTLPARITLESVPMIMDPTQVPPEPNSALNSATLAGVDSNNNGLRDDIERWIASSYKAPAERAVVAQMAKSMQSVAYYKAGKMSAEDSIKLFQASNVCEQGVAPDGNSDVVYSWERLQKIKARTYNNSDRTLAKRERGQELVGIHPGPGENGITLKNACEINLGNASTIH